MSDKSNYSVLIVDDEMILREIFTTYLRRAGFTKVFEACDGQEAFEICQKEKFDLITLDHKMPKMNGADLVKKLRADCVFNKETPVIMISGFLEDFQEEISSLKKVYFAEKPIEHEQFIHLVQKSL